MRSAVCLFTVLLSTTPGVAAEEVSSIREVISGGVLTWDPASDMLGARLVIKGSDGSVRLGSYTSEEALLLRPVDELGAALPDGWYRYELKIWSAGKAGGELGREGSLEDRGLEVQRLLGTFRVEGALVVELSAESTEQVPGHLPRDQVVGDDLVVDRLCAGVECVDGEPFAGEQVKIKDAAPALTFEDTSTSPAATTDWQLVANETAEEFSLDDLDAATRPLVIEAGAPTGSLHVDAQGRLGLGTSVPTSQLQIAGSAPEVRLDDDLSAVSAGLEVSSGSLRIEGDADQDVVSIDAAAPADSLVIASSGAVGLGTSLEVVSSVGSGNIVVRETDPTVLKRDLFELYNNGAPTFLFHDTNSGESWQFSMGTDGRFQISRIGTGGSELEIRADGRVRMGPGAVSNFDLDPAGNLVLLGDLTANGMFYPSSRELKTDFVAVDGRDVLERLATVPVSEWRYKADEEKRRHVGPVAEDFAAAFGVGSDARGLNLGDVAGLTLAAVQGLSERLEEAEARIEELALELERERSQHLVDSSADRSERDSDPPDETWKIRGEDDR